MKRTLCICMCAVMLLGLVIPFTASAATLINQVSFTLAQPEAGKIPPGTATWHGQGYSVYSIDWYDRTDGRFLEVNEKIQADHQYKATLWVMAMDGYEFACKDDRTPSITAYINGEACETVKAYEYNAWAMVCVNYYFSAVPAKGWISSVNLTVSAPVAGQKPGYSQITGSGYATGNVSFGDKTNENMKNGIAWYTADWNYLKPESDSFAEKTAYVFHCLLFPEDGYRFKPDCAVYVNGKQADVSLDYDLFLSVSFQFPATGTIPSSHTHTPSPWRTTGIYHYTVCTVCGDMLDQEDHKGGVATCAQKGKCTVCGYEYIDVNENHTPDTSKWVARGDMYHYHPCELCGAHADMEDHRWSPTYLYQDEKGHAWICADCKATSAIEKHNPGAEATETTPQTCKDCGYIITPAKNHTHTLTKVDVVEATCLEDGNIAYYTCDGCSDWFRDEEGKARFTDRKDVLVSATGHKDENQDGKCDVCGFVEDIPVPIESQPVTETPVKTEPTAPQTDGNQQTISGWLLPVLIGVPCFAGALIAMILVLKGKGKKENEENT